MHTLSMKNILLQDILNNCMSGQFVFLEEYIFDQVPDEESIGLVFE